MELELKIGDFVYSEEFGYGVVVKIDEKMYDDLPYLVQFDNEHPKLHDGNICTIDITGEYAKNTCYWCNTVKTDYVDQDEVVVKVVAKDV